MSQYNHAKSTSSNETLFRIAVQNKLSQFTANTFLDLGSGNGFHSLKLAKLLHAKNVICFDHDPSVFSNSSSQITPLVSDLNFHLPLANKSIDFVLANQVIEHIAKTDMFVSEIYRVLTKDGKAIICTPNLASWHNVFALALGWQPFSMQISDKYFLGNPKHPLHKTKIHEIQAHLRVFTHLSLKELLYSVGFNKVEVTGAGYYPLTGLMAQTFANLDTTHSAYIVATAYK